MKQTIETNELKIIVGELLFQFSSFDNWVNTAEIKFSSENVRLKDVLCVDNKGRILKKGKEFRRAENDDSFPVKVYRALFDN